MEICVFGAGSLGSLVGGVLAREHDVILVGREPHVGAIEDAGLQITGEISDSVQPRASTAPPEQTDLAVVTVKSFDTERAARELGGCVLDGVLSLQNGMGNESMLAAELDCPVLAGTCTYGARIEEPGTVECTGLGEITLGPADGGDSELADRTGTAFQQAGLETRVSAEMPRKLWEKLAVNAGINATTALARIQNGALLEGSIREIARKAACEAARVARDQGHRLSGQQVMDRTFEVAETTAQNTSSMHQDIRAEKRTEIDAINGYIVERAEKPALVNETLTALLRAWERERGLRQP
ncbi:MAG: ketopantoate reductase family protein [Halovenus sp.]|uniref:ketopantoate reductase family protein n=1 Tax=Halovenus amylolytica TaxID=2500550 RepID=UPI000FE32F47